MQKKEMLLKQGKRAARSFLSFQAIIKEEEQKQPGDTKKIIRSISDELDQSSMQLCACTKLRIFLCVLDPPINAVLQCKPCIVKRLIPLMCAFEKNIESKIQLEVAWIFSNLLSGTQKQVKHLIDCGILDAMMHVISEIPLTKPSVLRTQIIWALSNIAADYHHSPLKMPQEEQVFDLGVKLFANSDCVNYEHLHVFAWLLTNMRRAKFPLKPSLQHLHMIVPVLGQILETQLLIDQQLWWDACTMLGTLIMRDSSTTNSENIQIQAVLDDGGALQGIFQCLSLHESCDSLLLCDSLEFIRRLACHGNIQQASLALNALPVLAKLIAHRKPMVRTSCYEVVGTIASKTESNLEECMKAGLITSLIKVIVSDSDIDHQITAAFALLDIVEIANTQQIQVLVAQDLLVAICESLTLGECICDEDMLQNVMIQLQEIMSKARSPDELDAFTKIIDECDGFSTLIDLSSSSTHSVHMLAQELLADYFKYEDCDACAHDSMTKKKKKNRNMILSESAQDVVCKCSSGCILKHIGGHSRRLCKPRKKQINFI